MPLFKRSFVFFVVFLVSCVLFSSFFVPTLSGAEFSSSGFVAKVWTILNENWTSFFLLLSELAAFLPGPWNGILQTIFRAVSQITRNSKKQL